MLGSTFSDNMVVQRGRDVVVWGEATAGAVVQIRFGDERSSTVADASGHWKTAVKAWGWVGRIRRRFPVAGSRLG